MSTVDAPMMQSAVTMIVGAATTTAFLTWFIAAQFSKNRRHFHQVMSQHNKEDDDRFLAIQEAQWELREYVARRDGTKSPPQRKPFPRRRYLQDDANGDDNGHSVS